MKINGEFFNAVLENLHEGVLFVDRNRRIEYWNKGAEKITGYKNSDVIGKFCSENILTSINNQGINLCHNKKSCPIVKVFNDGNSHTANVYFNHKNGHRLPARVVAIPVKGSDGKMIGAIEILNDNSPHITLLDRIKKLEDMALLDSLTGIANRRFTEMQLSAKLGEFQRYGVSFGVLFIDIDHFKRINDIYGHETGDKVLKMVANTLLKSSRSYDLIGRWGGEEFITIIPYIDKEHLYGIANKYCMLVAMSNLPHHSDTIRVTISIGGTLCKKDDTVETVVKRADKLMYKSKVAGRNRITIE